MTDTTHPSKQLVRDFMDARTRSLDPPLTPAEIRRQLGWGLSDAARVLQRSGYGDAPRNRIVEDLI